MVLFRGLPAYIYMASIEVLNDKINSMKILLDQIASKLMINGSVENNENKEDKGKGYKTIKNKSLLKESNLKKQCFKVFDRLSQDKPATKQMLSKWGFIIDAFEQSSGLGEIEIDFTDYINECV